MTRTDTVENTIVLEEGEVFVETEFPGYFVSNYGRMYSYRSRYKEKRRTYQVLGFQVNRSGYNVVTISDDICNKTRHILVHRLVFATFNSIRWADFKQRSTIDHIDGDKTNNRLDNLELVSVSLNVSRSWNEQGLRDKSMKPVNKYTLDGRYIATYKNARLAAEDSISDYQKISPSIVSIHNVCRRYKNRRSALGFQWRFSDDAPAGIDIEKCVDNPCLNRAKRVAQKTPDGQLVEVWPSAYRAGKALGVGSRSISAAARGDIRTAYGFVWEYVDKEVNND